MSRIITVDMESGNLNSEYDFWGVGAGHTMELVSSARIHGALGHRWHKATGVSGGASYAGKSHNSALYESWTRFCFELAGGFAMGAGDEFIFFVGWRGTSVGAWCTIHVQLIESGGNIYLRFQVRDDSNVYHDVPASPGIQIEVGRKYPLEFYHKCHGGAGVLRWWLDGVQQAEKTNLVNSSRYIQSWGPYVFNLESTTGGNIYYDDIAVDDAQRIYPHVRRRRGGGYRRIWG